MTIAPIQIDGCAGAGAEAVDMAARPGGGKGRKRRYSAVWGRLEQHFHDAGRAAEVAVDLERRVGVEKVRIGAAATTGVRALILVGTDIAQQAAVHLVGQFALTEPGIEIDAPAAAPSCRFKALYFQCFKCSLRKRIFS